MSHRIAELMLESEKARTKAARSAAANECSELIVRLWEKRSAWPQGWPPPSAASVLEKLADLDKSTYWRYEADIEVQDANSWLETFPLIQRVQKAEVEIWREAALAEIDMEDARQWLNEHRKQMEADERRTLEDIIRAADSSRARFDRFAALKRKKKVPKEPDFAARLRKLASERRQLIKQAMSGSKPVRITPGRKKARGGPARSTRD